MEDPPANDFLAGIFDRFGIPRAYLAHLRELKSRLLRILFTVAFFYSLFFFFEFREVGRAGDLPIFAPFFSPFHPAAAQLLGRLTTDLIPPDVTLLQFAPAEIVILYMQISLVLAIACSMPMILYQFGRFVMPALYPHERRELVRLIAPALLLFGVGCVFAYKVVVPPILNFLFEYTRELIAGNAGTVGLTASIGQAIEFALMIVLVFGVVFEMPLIMSALTRIGIVAAKTWRHYWRHALAGFVIVGGLITPDTSGVTQVLVAVPMICLYFGGCLLAVYAERRASAQPTPAAS